MSKAMSMNGLQDAYKRIRSNLELSRRPSSVIAVLSAKPGEGRSSVAYHLAESFADKGEKVLLINADVNSTGLDQKAGLRPSVGLREIAASFDPLKPAFQPDKMDEILLPSGQVLYYIGGGSANPRYDVIHSRSFAKLIKEAAREMDKIILDSPASTVNADAMAIGAIADEAVFVYNTKKTGKYEAKEAMEELERNGAKVNGIVMTESGRLKH